MGAVIMAEKKKPGRKRRNNVKITVSISAELRDWIQQRADRNLRNFSAEFSRIVELFRRLQSGDQEAQPPD